ncbi:hypothetical protein V8D89_011826 [Ganoderma adspersum]
MVGFTARFALLAALSSIAALTVLPAPVRGGLVNADAQDLGPSIAARHSVHGTAINAAAAAAANTDGDPSADAQHRRKHHKSSRVGGDAPSHSSGTNDQQSPTSLVPLPAQLVRHPNKELDKENGNKDEPRTHRPNSKGKHAKQAREVYSIDPVTRMRTLWVAGGITVRDVRLETFLPRLDKRHHHHHHHHDHGSDKVVVKGDDDDVSIHHRSLSLIAPPGQVGDPDLEHEDVFVEGANDHIHIHDHYLDDNPSAVVVNGIDDHVHVRRAPMSHHHHHHNPDTVVVNGDDQHVHVHREPSPHHHHHRPEKVVVNGDNDHVHLHRSHLSRTHLAHHHGEVVVNGGHDEAHHRAARRRHHSHKTVIKGDHQHVHFGRSPVASPEPHHHHHHHHRPDKVVVKGNHDHVDVHRKRFQDYRHPIIIGGNRGKAYLIPQKEPVVDSPLSTPAGTKRHVRRDAPFTGVPGTIEIMSQDSESKVTRIASLVVATPSNGSTVAGSPFVLNASDTDRTQMYMVPAISATNSTSASSNSSLPVGPPAAPSAGLPVPSPGSASPSTDPQASSASPSTESVEPSFVKVFLQMPIFDAASAQLKPYCATFDPRPLSAAPMTVEKCMDAASSAFHKSQVFAYEPNSGYLHPMWYSGQDDGLSNDDSESTAPPAPDSAPSAPSSAPATAAPASPPAAPSPPVGPAGDTPSPPVNSSTSVPDGVPAVTSFEQEALEVEFGDSTHAPVRASEIFAAEALQNAKNVTLRFAPTTPEVLPNSGVGKVAELPVVSVPVNPPVANPAPDADTGAAAGPATQSAASSSDVDSGATTTAAPATSVTGTETDDASTTDAGSSAVTEQASATPSDGGAGDSLSAQDLLAPAAPTQALEVDVDSVDASDTAGASSSSSSGSDSSSAAAAPATVSTNVTDSGSSTSSMPSMTPVSTAPYEWMFKGTNASP